MTNFPLLRNLLRTPGETALAVLALGAGMGLTTTLFSIIKGVLWISLPVPRIEELVRVDTNPNDLPGFLAQQTNFSTLAGVVVSGANGEVASAPKRLQVARVSPNLFNDVLQATTLLGITRLSIVPERTALISHSLWRDSFRSDPNVTGKRLRIDSEDIAIVGVMPAGFGFPRTEDVWMAWEHSPESPAAATTRGSAAFLVARLKPGATAESASAEVNVILRRLHVRQPGEAPLPAVAVASYAGSNVKGGLRTLLIAIFTCCLFVLLIACANVANLSLARAARRPHELGLRCALGATRGNLIRMLLAENIALALGGAAVGILFATGALDIFVRYLQAEAPLTGGAPAGIEYTIDRTVLAFVILLTTATALVSGLAPALLATRLDLEQLIRSGSKAITLRSGRFGTLLIHVQLAASVLLLIGTGMMGSMLVQLGSHTGYDPTKIWSARAELPAREHLRILTVLGASNKVEAVALTTAEHIERTAHANVTTDRGVTGARWQAITPGYFAVFGSTLRSGRFFNDRDVSGAPKVAMVNRAFARRHWPNIDPLGRNFKVERESLTVVGLVDDIGSLKAGPQPDLASYYVPLAQIEAREVSIVLRSRNDAHEAIAEAISALRGIPGAPPVFQAHTAAEIMDMEAIGIRIPAVLFVACGLSGLLLSAIGTYGVLSLAARQRTREMASEWPWAPTQAQS